MNQPPQPQSDLSSILQTLSAYAPPQPLQQQQQHLQLYHPPPPTHLPLPNPDHEEGELLDEEEDYDPATSLAYQLSPPPPQPHANLSHPTHSDPHAQPRPQRPPPPSSSSSSKPLLPPSISHITSYPLALRHITTHLLPHPHFIPRIRHLIHEQHKHEREWHRDREKLVQQLGSREASRRKLDAVLASVGAGAMKPRDDDGKGGGGGGAGQQRAELTQEQELRLFDRKVWKAQKEMVGAAERELGRLGVPFFGGGGEKGEGGKEELRELRGKVLGLLEDLCGEDEGG